MKRRKRNKITVQIFMIFMTLVIASVAGGVCIAKKEEQKRQQEQQKKEILNMIQNADSVQDICAGIAWELNRIDGEIQQEETEEQQPDGYAVFDCMSEDWGSEDVEGFVLYELPEEYQKTGYLPEKMQIYIRCLCKQYDVPYALVLAMIERESGYVFDAVGDDENSIGYMQVYEKWHIDRMERLGVNDLKNPYQNVLVGIDYLAELIEKYGTIQDALATYNYGAAGARKHLWNKGIYMYEYNSTIMNRMEEIKEEFEGKEVNEK